MNKVLAKKQKDYTNFICSSLIFVLGFLSFLIPASIKVEPHKLLCAIMIIYFGIKICEGFLTRKYSEMEHIWIAVACALSAASIFAYKDLNSNILVSISLGIWILILVIVKLIKITEYRESENNLMYFNIVTLSVFTMIGVLSILTIYFNQININLILAFFFFINGILCLSETEARILKDNKRKTRKK